VCGACGTHTAFGSFTVAAASAATSCVRAFTRTTSAASACRPSLVAIPAALALTSPAP